MNEENLKFRVGNNENIEDQVNRSAEDVELIQQYLSSTKQFPSENKVYSLQQIMKVSDNLLVTCHEGWKHDKYMWRKSSLHVNFQYKVPESGFLQTDVLNEKLPKRDSNYDPIPYVNLTEAEVFRKGYQEIPLEAKLRFTYGKYFPNPSFEPGERIERENVVYKDIKVNPPSNFFKGLARRARNFYVELGEDDRF